MDVGGCKRGAKAIRKIQLTEIRSTERCSRHSKQADGITLAKDNCSVEWNNLVTDVPVKNEEAARGPLPIILSSFPSSSSTVFFDGEDLISLFIKDVHLNERASSSLFALLHLRE